MPSYENESDQKIYFFNIRFFWESFEKSLQRYEQVSTLNFATMNKKIIKSIFFVFNLNTVKAA
jgi:hypothetical protein